MWGILLTAAGLGLAYAFIRKSSDTAPKPLEGSVKSSDGKSYAWGFISPDAPPGNVFYIDTSTGVGVYSQTPPKDREMLPNGSIVSAVLLVTPASGGPQPPLVYGRFTVVANYTGEHNPHDFKNVDPKSWYYDLRFEGAINTGGAPVTPPVGLSFTGIPSSLIGGVLAKAT